MKRSLFPDIPASLIDELEAAFPTNLPAKLEDCTGPAIARLFGRREVIDFLRNMARRQTESK